MSAPSHIEVALELAKRSGEIMRKNFVRNMKKEWKDDRSPVTETDLTINSIVLTRLKEAFPGHSVLAEEESDFSEESEYVWICDPVDGTHNFSHGIPTATFALALVHEGVPILSVVYDPFLDRTYAAERGKGATQNGETIHVSSAPHLKKTLIGMGKMKKIGNLFPIMEAGYDSGVSFITGLSIHYMCALVAAGEFSAAFFGGPSPHDITASKLLVEEAGGKATDFLGRGDERYDRELAGQVFSNGIIHDELLALVEKYSPIKQ
ncbi:MAG: hypothetical protein RLZZ416_544 [Candidatus Parcubacteria bacterium]|jgi:myo-inositol-1(or 4)-monophosphatase